jgi:hypothetical protein
MNIRGIIFKNIVYKTGLKLGVMAFMLLAIFIPGSANSTRLYAATPPYPNSSVIERINWDFDLLNSILNFILGLAPGSDLWPVTWGADGNIYTSWGDGGGFGGTNSDGRVSLGFARISGNPQNFTTKNIWGGKNAENPAQFTGKTASIISVDGVLYSWLNTQNRTSGPDYKLMWSTDNGDHWSRSSWSMNSGSFALATFLNFGRDYQGSRDNYVYSYGGKWGNTSRVYLARVLKQNLTNINAYEYVSGFNSSGNPVWSSNSSSRVPIFADSQANGFNSSLLASPIFNPHLNRYLLTIPHGDAGQWGVFDAPEPWGPWTTVDYYNNWGGYSSFSSEPLVYSFSTKWMSSNGLEIWMTYSGAGGNLDAFRLIKGTLVLKDPGGQNSPTPNATSTPAPPSSTSTPPPTSTPAPPPSTSTPPPTSTPVPPPSTSTPTPPSTGGLVYQYAGPKSFNGVNEYVDTKCCSDMGKWTVSVIASSPNAPTSGKASGPVYGEKNCCTITWNHPNQKYRGALAVKVKGVWHGTSFGNLSANRQYHLAGTYDGETLRAYRDGVLVSQNGSMSGPPDSEWRNVLLARHPAYNYYFKGTVADVKIFDRVLTASEIAAFGNVSTNSNSLNSLVYEMPGARYLDGVNDYIDTKCCADMDQWSVSARVSSPKSPRSDKISGPVNGEQNCCKITWDHVNSNFRRVLEVKVKGVWYRTSFGQLSANKTYHLAGTYDGETLKAYKDGVLVSQNGSMSGAPDSEPRNVLIGKHPYADYFFHGIVADVKIFNRALSAGEIAALNQAD